MSSEKTEINTSSLCRIKDTVQMINLAVARIEHAMREGDDSIFTLTDSFTELVKRMQAIEAAAEDLQDSPGKSIIRENSAAVSRKTQAAIIAFQFYDRLSQRLNHVSHSLAALTSLLDDQQRLADPEAWLGLQDTIRAKYTLDADKAMFEALLQGQSIEEIMQQANQQNSDDDIELF
ncbi:MAG: hypothetical protein PVJ63_00860 [Thioalkalispiraceae bacterium]